jgi:hypothetical protein
MITNLNPEEGSSMASQTYVFKHQTTRCNNPEQYSLTAAWSFGNNRTCGLRFMYLWTKVNDVWGRGGPLTVVTATSHVVTCFAHRCSQVRTLLESELPYYYLSLLFLLSLLLLPLLSVLLLLSLSLTVLSLLLLSVLSLLLLLSLLLYYYYYYYYYYYCFQVISSCVRHFLLVAVGTGAGFKGIKYVPKFVKIGQLF